MSQQSSDQHYSEADLLETYYTQPGESMPAMMHLARCSDCAAKYERLERKLREAAVCSTDKPETFWTRQRMTIMRRVAGQRRSAGPARIAAAAALAFVVGGAVVYESVKPHAPAPAPVAITQTAPAPVRDDITAAHDPWQSEELEDFRPVVAWESWVAETPQVQKEKPL